MAEVGRLESCKAEVMRRLIKDKWSDVETVSAASHLLTPAIPPGFDAAVSSDKVPNSGQVNDVTLLALLAAYAAVCGPLLLVAMNLWP